MKNMSSAPASGIAAKAFNGAEPLKRTRFLVVASAWWTLCQMELTGISFDEFLRLAASDRPPEKEQASFLWSELTVRLTQETVSALVKFPESVLTDEAREFIEALIVGSLRHDAK